MKDSDISDISDISNILIFRKYQLTTSHDAHTCGH